MSLLTFANLFPEFQAPSWAGWRAVLARLTDSVREFYGIVGRGAGKSRIVALVACWFAAAREYQRVPGEYIYVGIFALANGSNRAGAANRSTSFRSRSSRRRALRRRWRSRRWRTWPTS